MTHGGDVYRNKVHMDFSVNLNPLGAPKEVMEAVKRSLEFADRYPDPMQELVRKDLADALGVKSENVCGGSGASELLMAAVRACDPKKALLFEPCFSGYEHALSAVSCQVIHQLTKPENGLSVSMADLEAIDPDMDLIIVCDPVSPAGCNLDNDVLLALLARAKEQGATVILDESFYLLSDQGKPADPAIRTDDAKTTEQRIRDDSKYSDRKEKTKSWDHIDRGSALISEYNNLIVIRSLTKTLAIPGIRCGYAIGDTKLIDTLTCRLPEWNLSVTSEAAIRKGIGVIAKADYIARSMSLIQKERTYLADKLKSLGLSVFESHAPFLLFTGPDGLYEKLLQKGILIRNCDTYSGLGKGYYRIGIKSHAENEELINAIRGIIDAI